MKKRLLLFAAVLAIIAIAIVSIPILITQPVYASHPCPVCGNLVGYETQIKWGTWTAWGFEKSGWVLTCDKCGYTTTRDANGNIPDPYLAQKAWQAKMFPWIHGN